MFTGLLHFSLSFIVRKIVLQCYAKSILCYAYETWTINKHEIEFQNLRFWGKMQKNVMTT